LRIASNADLIAFLGFRESVRIGKMNMAIGDSRNCFDTTTFPTNDVTMLSPADFEFQTDAVWIVLKVITTLHVEEVMGILSENKSSAEKNVNKLKTTCNKSGEDNNYIPSDPYRFSFYQLP
jgi:hypothetical protein